METIKPVEIPQSHIDFANAIADLADAHSMDHVAVDYRPAWDTPVITGLSQMGDVKIIYRSVDGRGRGCRNLTIQVNSIVTHKIESNRESSN